jgi:hypothetical protein
MEPLIKKIILLLAFVLAACNANAVTILGGLERFVDLTSGGHYQGKLLLQNLSPDEETVKIYVSDYRFFSNGSNEFGQPGSHARSNAGWIKFAPERLTIAARSTAAVDYEINVPDSTELDGAFWSIILIEPLSDNHPEKIPSPNGKKDKGMSITSTMRFAVLVHTNINSKGKRSIKFGNRTFTQKKDQSLLLVDIENNGTSYFRHSLWVELFDQKGISLGRFTGNNLMVLPGCSVKHKVDLTGVPPGKYNGLFVADSGDAEILGARYQVDIPSIQNK